MTGVIGIVERLFEKRLSKRAYFGIFVLTFSMVAFFKIWSEQFERANALETKLKGRSEQPTIQVNVPLTDC